MNQMEMHHLHLMRRLINTAFDLESNWFQQAVHEPLPPPRHSVPPDLPDPDYANAIYRRRAMVLLQDQNTQVIGQMASTFNRIRRFDSSDPGS
jgi:hypothetical protein